MAVRYIFLLSGRASRSSSLLPPFPPSPPRQRRRRRRRALPQFFPAQSNAESISGRRASIASPSARIRGINANSCRAYLALSSPPGKTREREGGGRKGEREEKGREKREREKDRMRFRISVYRRAGMRRASSHLWILRCLFCAMQNSIRHEIVGKQVVPALTLIYRERRS